ncbi:MAG: 7-cyano-7-deazaguanine synthase [Pirellulales bacterium]
MQNNHEPTTGVLLSGGVDSAVLLDQLLGRGWRVVPFYVRTGCIWESCELNAVRRLLKSLAQPRLLELVLLDMPLMDLYGDHWSMTGTEVPDETSPDEAVFLPGRNPLLLIKPALWCRMHGIEQLALATLADNPFDDASPEFFTQFEAMFRAATGEHVQIVRPFDRLPKHRVMEMGRHLPLELTFSCLAPVDGQHCGCCNKCAERRKAFRRLQSVDPTTYADACIEARGRS